MVNLADVPLREAVRMMTLTPANVMGFRTKGALSAGMDADIVVFDNDINVKAVFVGGEQRINKI
jgi:N-acetylglucosamine-6-phosphate deacetylase